MNVDATAADILAEHGYGPPTLPEEFWAARPVLGHIRQAAHAKLVSAEATLHVVLTRIAGATPHTVKLPGIVGGPVGLCYFVNLLGGTGAGKSSANTVGCELVRVDWDRVADQLPLGSGEGLAEILFDTVEEDVEDDQGRKKKQKVRKQVRWNAIVYIDEGQMLAELGRRNGSTLLPTLRTIWSGGVLGQTNASLERRRIVPAGQFAFGIVMAVQAMWAGPLLDDAEAGTPGRFTWANAIDPGIPDELPAWPGRLRWEPPPVGTGTLQHLVPDIITVDDAIVAQLVDEHRARRRGHLKVASLDAHRSLMRLKLAALLGLLDDPERLSVTLEDWHLAGMLVDHSDRVRDDAIAEVKAQAGQKERATVDRLNNRAAEADEAVARRRVISCSARIAKLVWSQSEPWNRGDLRRRTPMRHRDVFDEALEDAIAQGHVVEYDQRTSHTGSPTSRVEKGAKRP